MHPPCNPLGLVFYALHRRLGKPNHIRLVVPRVNARVAAVGLIWLAVWLRHTPQGGVHKAVLTPASAQPMQPTIPATPALTLGTTSEGLLGLMPELLGTPLGWPLYGKAIKIYSHIRLGLLGYKHPPFYNELPFRL